MFVPPVEDIPTEAASCPGSTGPAGHRAPGPTRLTATGATHDTAHFRPSLQKPHADAATWEARPDTLLAEGSLGLSSEVAEGPEAMTSLPLLPVANQWSLRACPRQVALPEPCFGQLSIPGGQMVGSPVASACGSHSESCCLSGIPKPQAGTLVEQWPQAQPSEEPGPLPLLFIPLNPASSPARLGRLPAFVSDLGG